MGWKKGDSKQASIARWKLNSKFLEDLMTVYDETGISAIRIMQKEEPTKFCLMLASLLPREMAMEISDSRLKELSDADVESFIDEFTKALRDRVAETEDGVRERAAATAH